MKHLSYLIAILIALVSLTSCEDGNVTKLKKEIAVANASCPVCLGIAGDLVSIKYYDKDNTVLLYYSVNEELSGGIFLKKNKGVMQKQFRLLFSNQESAEMLKDIVNAKAGVTIVYKAPSSGKTVKYSLPYEELKDIKNNPLSSQELNRMIIETKVEVENSRCPFKSDEGMVTAKVAIVDDYIVYYYEMDESMTDIKEMKRKQSQYKEYMAGELKKLRRDPTIQRELQMLVPLGMGYQYRYYGNKSKEYVDVIFTPEELAQHISR